MAPLTDISSRAFAVANSTEPISRTMQYRKITKPLLERQRRARINRSLDELKDILITGLQSEGENVARLEKADILELTVRHLHKLQQQVLSSSSSSSAASNSPPISSSPMETNCTNHHHHQMNLGSDEKFHAGFSSCAKEVSKLLASTPKMDIQVGTSLMVHLGNTLNQLINNNNNHHHHNNNATMMVSPTNTSMTSSSPLSSYSSTTSSLSPPMSSPTYSIGSIESYRPYTPPSSPEEEESNNNNNNDTQLLLQSLSPKSKSIIKKHHLYGLHHHKIMWRPW